MKILTNLRKGNVICTNKSSGPPLEGPTEAYTNPPKSIKNQRDKQIIVVCPADT